MRPDLPTGTVTFLFTDVEGSTRLLHELGAEGYAEALAEHRRVIRAACVAEGGVEVDTQGDAFFFAFPTAPGALAAATDFTDGLSVGPIRVRVGVHTGTPLVADEGYVGDDVHFAARVGSTGHGGQVVVSWTTAALVDTPLGDLGEHRLKDITEPVPLYQLGEGAFPSLKTISNTNLPRPASSFLGRETEVAEVLSRIERGARLVTLTGPGGTGKTRLAIEAASTRVGSYKAGVFWVGLASLRDPALVVETISQVLGAKADLASHIAERELLLLLDNLEQVIEAAPELSRLLESCANLTLLVTSRELLRVRGEVEYAVPPLATQEAVDLFCARSQLEPSEEVADLCARLDSLPLAVELAAARTKALTVSQIADRLSDRLDLLKGGRDADPRQRTLRATIEWSYELLSPDEQALFARLSVFAGGCTLEAAEEVVGADLDSLQSLVEKSLLRFTDSRYWMLETIREYAGERLADPAALSRVHAEWVVALLERTPSATSVEVDNLRTALTWTREVSDATLELRLAHATRRYWANTGHVREGLAWLLGAAFRGPTTMDEQRAMVLNTAMFCAQRLGDLDRAREIAEEQLTVSRRIGGSAYVAGLAGLATVLAETGEAERARSLYAQGVTIARAEGRTSILAVALFNASGLEFTSANYETSLEMRLEARELFSASDDAQGAAHSLLAIGDSLFYLGRRKEGLERMREGLAWLEELDLPVLVAAGLLSFADAACHEGALERATTLLGAHGKIMRVTGEAREMAEEVTYRRIETEGQARLGAACFDEVFGAGAAMDRADAVAYARASID